jgi:hypothetical protein
MFSKVTVGLVTLAATGLLVVGVISYWRGVPRDALWINAQQDAPRLQAALIGGTLHVVYSAPRRIGPGDKELIGAGFYLKRVIIGKTEAIGVGAPFWAPSGLLLSVPLTALLRGPVRRRRRRRRGECVKCGYSLTGLTLPRCPECGQEYALSDCAGALRTMETASAASSDESAGSTSDRLSGMQP